MKHVTAWMPAEFCSESLQADVSTDLRAIWTTIGVPEDAQQAQIQELSGKIAALLRGAVQHEEGRQGQLKEEVERMTRELGELCATLAETQPDLTADPPGLLVQQHAAAAAAVECSKVQRANRRRCRRVFDSPTVSAAMRQVILAVDVRPAALTCCFAHSDAAARMQRAARRSQRPTLQSNGPPADRSHGQHAASCRMVALQSTCS